MQLFLTAQVAILFAITRVAIRLALAQGLSTDTRYLGKGTIRSEDRPDFYFPDYENFRNTLGTVQCLWEYGTDIYFLP